MPDGIFTKVPKTTNFWDSKHGYKLKKATCQHLHSFLTDVGIPRRKQGSRLSLKKRLDIARERGFAI